MIANGAWDVLRNHIYEISEVLKTISLPKDNTQKSILLQMEFIMYDNLCHYMNTHEIHLMQEINKDPSLLMEIYALVLRQKMGLKKNILKIIHK